MGDEIRSLIQRRANASEIRELAVRFGMIPLIQDGVQQVVAGRTTFEEVSRVASEH